MKLKSKKHICLLVAIGLFLSPLCAYAKPKSKHFNSEKTGLERKENRISAIQQKLDLSPEQAGQLKTLRNTHREQRRQFRDDIKAKKEDLRKELQKQDLDMGRIDQLHSELKTMLGQREDDRLKHILEVREILTSEQLAKFLEWKEEFPRKSRKKRRKGKQ